MSNGTFANITDIEEMLLLYDSLINEGHIISLVNIKNTLKLSTDLSQKFLQYYYDQRKEQLTVTYLVEGYKPNGTEYVCAVVSENELQNLKDAENYTKKIYSIKSKYSRADANSLWKQELNEINKLCKKVDFQKELFIPQFSDIVLHDLKLKQRKVLSDETNKSTLLINRNSKDETPIKIKKEKVNDEERKQDLGQTNKGNQSNDKKTSAKTFLKSTNNRTLHDFIQIKNVKRKRSDNYSPEESSKKTAVEETINANVTIKTENGPYTGKDTTSFAKHTIDCGKNVCEQKRSDENLTTVAKINAEINNQVNTETDAETNGEINSKFKAEIKDTPQKLFHSDSSSDESDREVNEVTNTKQNEKKKETVVEEEVREPAKKMHRIQSVKETQMYFEDGYLVTKEKDKCIHLTETDSPKKNQILNSTVLMSANKKRKSTQQTLLTDFLKKKK